MVRACLVCVLSFVACSSGSGDAQPVCGSFEPLTQSEIQSVCQKAAATPCADAIPYEVCVAEIDAFVAEYANDCCGAQAAALLRCGNQHGFRCADLSDDTLFTPACASVEEAFDVCAGSHDNCTASIDLQGQSGYECDQYAASCQGDACSCTYGPHVGTSFTLTGDTYEESVASVAAACK